MNEYLKGQLQELGCKNIAASQVCIHVYIELTEVKKYWNTKFHHDKILSIPYITGQKNRNSENIIFVPMQVADSLSFNDMQKYFSLSQNNESIYLAIVDSDSTTVYYQISQGIAATAQSGISRLQDRDRRQHNDSVLQKSFKVIQEAALCGLTVDLLAKGIENSEMEKQND